jgi:hypothetical protein
MQVTLCKKRWKLRYTTLHLNRGECDAPHVKNKEIRIDKRLSGQEELEVLLHEAMHGCDWRADEEHVARSSEDIARMLWKLGYRRSG